MHRHVPGVPDPRTGKPRISLRAPSRKNGLIRPTGLIGELPGPIRAMQPDDVDLARRRITIAGNERPLDDLTYRAPLDWLDYRRRRWPNTANPHLLISLATALGHGPVSAVWIRELRGAPATLEQMRIDRQLDEALATGGDPLHLAVVFGVCDSTAIRHAANARALLQTPSEASGRSADS